MRLCLLSWFSVQTTKHRRLFLFLGFLIGYLYTDRKITLQFYCDGIRFTVDSHPVPPTDKPSQISHSIS